MPRSNGMRLLLCHDCKYNKLPSWAEGMLPYNTWLIQFVLEKRLLKITIVTCEWIIPFKNSKILFEMIFSDEGIFVDTNGKRTKDLLLQWGVSPSDVGKFATGWVNPKFWFDIDLFSKIVTTLHSSRIHMYSFFDNHTVSCKRMRKHQFLCSRDIFISHNNIILYCIILYYIYPHI